MFVCVIVGVCVCVSVNAIKPCMSVIMAIKVNAITILIDFMDMAMGKAINN